MNQHIREERRRRRMEEDGVGVLGWGGRVEVRPSMQITLLAGAEFVLSM